MYANFVAIGTEELSFYSYICNMDVYADWVQPPCDLRKGGRGGVGKGGGRAGGGRMKTKGGVGRGGREGEEKDEE